MVGQQQYGMKRFVQTRSKLTFKGTRSESVDSGSSRRKRRSNSLESEEDEEDLSPLPENWMKIQTIALQNNYNRIFDKLQGTILPISTNQRKHAPPTFEQSTTGSIGLENLKFENSSQLQLELLKAIGPVKTKRKGLTNKKGHQSIIICPTNRTNTKSVPPPSISSTKKTTTTIDKKVGEIEKNNNNFKSRRINWRNYPKPWLNGIISGSSSSRLKIQKPEVIRKTKNFSIQPLPLTSDLNFKEDIIIDGLGLQTRHLIGHKTQLIMKENYEKENNFDELNFDDAVNYLRNRKPIILRPLISNIKNQEREVSKVVTDLCSQAALDKILQVRQSDQEFSDLKNMTSETTRCYENENIIMTPVTIVAKSIKLPPPSRFQSMSSQFEGDESEYQEFINQLNNNNNKREIPYQCSSQDVLIGCESTKFSDYGPKNLLKNGPLQYHKSDEEKWSDTDIEFRDNRSFDEIYRQHFAKANVIGRMMEKEKMIGQFHRSKDGEEEEDHENGRRNYQSNSIIETNETLPLYQLNRGYTTQSVQNYVLPPLLTPPPLPPNNQSFSTIHQSYSPHFFPSHSSGHGHTEQMTERTSSNTTGSIPTSLSEISANMDSTCSMYPCPPSQHRLSPESYIEMLPKTRCHPILSTPQQQRMNDYSWDPSIHYHQQNLNLQHNNNNNGQNFQTQGQTQRFIHGVPVQPPNTEQSHYQIQQQFPQYSTHHYQLYDPNQKFLEHTLKVPPPTEVNSIATATTERLLKSQESTGSTPWDRGYKMRNYVQNYPHFGVTTFDRNDNVYTIPPPLSKFSYDHGKKQMNEYNNYNNESNFQPPLKLKLLPVVPPCAYEAQILEKNEPVGKISSLKDKKIIQKEPNTTQAQPLENLQNTKTKKKLKISLGKSIYGNEDHGRASASTSLPNCYKKFEVFSTIQEELRVLEEMRAKLNSKRSESVDSSFASLRVLVSDQKLEPMKSLKRKICRKTLDTIKHYGHKYCPCYECRRAHGLCVNNFDSTNYLEQHETDYVRKNIYDLNKYKKSAPIEPLVIVDTPKGDKVPPLVCFTRRKGYGKIPNYLQKRKEEIAKDRKVREEIVAKKVALELQREKQENLEKQFQKMERRRLAAKANFCRWNGAIGLEDIKVDKVEVGLENYINSQYNCFLYVNGKVQKRQGLLHNSKLINQSGHLKGNPIIEEQKRQQSHQGKLHLGITSTKLPQLPPPLHTNKWQHTKSRYKDFLNNNNSYYRTKEDGSSSISVGVNKEGGGVMERKAQELSSEALLKIPNKIQEDVPEEPIILRIGEPERPEMPDREIFTKLTRNFINSSRSNISSAPGRIISPVINPRLVSIQSNYVFPALRYKLHAVNSTPLQISPAADGFPMEQPDSLIDFRVRRFM